MAEMQCCYSASFIA